MQAIEASPEAIACRQQGLRLADPLEVVARSLRLLGSRHPNALAISLRGLSAMGQVPANCRPTSPRFQPWALPYRRRPAAPPSRPCLPSLCGNWHDHQMKRRSLLSLLLAGSAGSAPFHAGAARRQRRPQHRGAAAASLAEPPSGHGAGGGLALGPAGCPAMEGGAALALQLSPAELNGRALAGVDPAMPE